MKIVATAAAALCLIGLLWWVQPPSDAQPIGTVKIDGSSTVFPISEAVAEEFQRSTRGTIRVTVGISGTGGGFKRFCRGEIDVQDASRPISSDEMEACRANGIAYHELPIAYDALTIVVHPQNSWAGWMTLGELKAIWRPSAQGNVVKWNHIRSTWPDAPLKLFGAGADSGTFDYFTEVVVGEAKASRGDYTASEDDNTLVQGIARDRYALGYVPFAYYEANRDKLKVVAVDAGKGPVTPSSAATENGQYHPLSRPLFIYVNSKSAQRSELKRLVEFYLAHARELVPQVKCVPLPGEVYTVALGNFRNGKVGSAFQGISLAGVRIEDMLKREARL